MKVVELFKGLQGEGTKRGMPMTFLRLHGCNLRCIWCDTLYAMTDKYEEVSVEEIINRITSKVPEPGWIYITGGEPLIQEKEVGELCTRLREIGYLVAVATNGSLEIPPWQKTVNMWNVDMKCPSSKVSSNSLESWFSICWPHEIKFVVATEDDLRFTENILSRHPEDGLRPNILISPMIGVEGTMPKLWLKKIWDYCVEKDLIFSLQEHKVVWGSLRGV